MNPSTSGAQSTVLFHQVDEQMDALGREVDVTVKRQNEHALRDYFLPLLVVHFAHQLIAEDVVQVPANTQECNSGVRSLTSLETTVFDV